MHIPRNATDPGAGPLEKTEQQRLLGGPFSAAGYVDENASTCVEQQLEGGQSGSSGGADGSGWLRTPAGERSGVAWRRRCPGQHEAQASSSPAHCFRCSRVLEQRRGCRARLMRVLCHRWCPRQVTAHPGGQLSNNRRLLQACILSALSWAASCLPWLKASVSSAFHPPWVQQKNATARCLGPYDPIPGAASVPRRIHYVHPSIFKRAFLTVCLRRLHRRATSRCLRLWLCARWSVPW